VFLATDSTQLNSTQLSWLSWVQSVAMNKALRRSCTLSQCELRSLSQSKFIIRPYIIALKKIVKVG